MKKVLLKRLASLTAGLIILAMIIKPNEVSIFSVPAYYYTQYKQNTVLDEGRQKYQEIEAMVKDLENMAATTESITKNAIPILKKLILFDNKITELKPILAKASATGIRLNTNAYRYLIRDNFILARHKVKITKGRYKKAIPISRRVHRKVNKFLGFFKRFSKRAKRYHKASKQAFTFMPILEKIEKNIEHLQRISLYLHDRNLVEKYSTNDLINHFAKTKKEEIEYKLYDQSFYHTIKSYDLSTFCNDHFRKTLKSKELRRYTNKLYWKYRKKCKKYKKQEEQILFTIGGSHEYEITYDEAFMGKLDTDTSDTNFDYVQKYLNKYSHYYKIPFQIGKKEGQEVQIISALIYLRKNHFAYTMDLKKTSIIIQSQKNFVNLQKSFLEMNKYKKLTLKYMLDLRKSIQSFRKRNERIAQRYGDKYLQSKDRLTIDSLQIWFCNIFTAKVNGTLRIDVEANKIHCTYKGGIWYKGYFEYIFNKKPPSQKLIRAYSRMNLVDKLFSKK